MKPSSVELLKLLTDSINSGDYDRQLEIDLLALSKMVGNSCDTDDEYESSYESSYDEED